MCIHISVCYIGLCVCIYTCGRIAVILVSVCVYTCTRIAVMCVYTCTRIAVILLSWFLCGYPYSCYISIFVYTRVLV